MSEPIVKELMTGHITTVTPGTNVKDAAVIMAEKQVGSLIVSEGGKTLGIITERDIIKRTVSPGKLGSGQQVKEIMTTEVISVGPEVTLSAAVKLMNDSNIRRLPVMEDDLILGIVTERDLMREVPSLLGTIHTVAELDEEPDDEVDMTSGHCDVCGSFSYIRWNDNSRMLCRYCLGG